VDGQSAISPLLGGRGIYDLNLFYELFFCFYKLGPLLFVAADLHPN